MADVIEPEAPVSGPTPFDRSVDFPDRLGDLLAWLAEAGFGPELRWADVDLVVIAASRPRRA